ncbi:ABC transporter ATP-binding protein/permease [Reyranella aquatilis]|uniref:ABC transporter ATP-binding protein/permease n=1 Tax=Reyranella aquatilis TaxID=2035356 RepID=A0ABS8L2L7_9HYPH|nr:ABC transporter ATP-binding protein/permease [Reyranella aquatilis]MCC8432546.1 ABC transporter ATP-binding protein/permease [Reyranella aquatilis]
MSKTVTDGAPKLDASRSWGVIAILGRHLWPKGETGLRVRVIVALALLVAAKVTNVYVPILYKNAVDMLGTPAAQAVAVPIALIVAYGVARVLSQAFGELRDAVFAPVAQRAIRNLALEVFGHLHALSLRFHLERQTGGLSRVIERGTQGMEFLIRFTTFNILPTLFEILLVGGILWSLYDWRFSVVTLVVVGAYIVFSIMLSEWRIKFVRSMNEADTDSNAKAIDSLLNFETVKYFGNEPHEARRYDVGRRRYENAAIRSSRTLSVLNVGQGAIISVGLVLVMAMAGQGVVAGTMTIGDFVAVNAFLIQLYMPLNMLGFAYREIRNALVNMEKMFGLLQVQAEIADKPGAPPLVVTGGEIVFDHVDFHYEKTRPILHDVSFRVAPGETVAIVGSSGAGKSTISRILFRFYDVASGHVRIDGQDIRDVQQASLRAAIGVVPQDTVLFNDTIYYNIAYGRPGATREEVEQAARLARIHDFIMALPQGYDSTVGERGLKLSGGEKQRVAIARTILKNPRILLFDEATSALDTRTEQEIQRSLEEVSRGRTTVIIAHRLSTIINADEIVVLDRGRVAERGRHADLLARDGLYADMWRRQQEAAAEAERHVEEPPSFRAEGHLRVGD